MRIYPRLYFHSLRKLYFISTQHVLYHIVQIMYFARYLIYCSRLPALKNLLNLEAVAVYLGYNINLNFNISNKSVFATLLTV